MYKKIVEFRPSISSENMGDQIIQLYITNIMNELFGEHLTVTMPTRSHLTVQNMRHVKSADYAFVCGTNLLASNMDKRKQWNLKKTEMLRLRNLILLGVGWWQYQDAPNLYTRTLLRNILAKDCLHSVRDSYTEAKLKSIGIERVVNTGCPSMWGLTKEKMDRVPVSKGEKVVTTLTNYMQNDDLDRFILETLIENYETVFVWLQAIEDYEQLVRMGYKNKVQIIPPALEPYNAVLMRPDIDYIGTRLHGGIHALNYEKRSLIIAVDNRAKEIAKDTNLPVIDRDEVKTTLETMINESWPVNIALPTENIQKWKEQFTHELSVKRQF